MNFHCHAPTCLMMAVYACGAGTPLTDCNATNGKLICMQKPIYGGTSNPLTKGTRFDEDGYIAIPGCTATWMALNLAFFARLSSQCRPIHAG